MVSNIVSLPSPKLVSLPSPFLAKTKSGPAAKSSDLISPKFTLMSATALAGYAEFLGDVATQAMQMVYERKLLAKIKQTGK